MTKLRKLAFVLLVFFLAPTVDRGVNAQTRPKVSGAISCESANPIPFPTKSPEPSEIRFAALGDTGRGCDDESSERSPQCAMSKRIAEVQKSTGFNLLLLLGDNVYERGNPKDFFEKLYNPYKQLAQNGVLIKGVLGNHDVPSLAGLKLQMKFFSAATLEEQAKFFSLPIEDQLKLPEVPKTFYTFTDKNNLAEFFALDSSMITGDCCGFFSSRNEYTEAEKKEHLDWLKSKLQASTAKWKIVLLHHPLYSSSRRHG